MVPLLYVIWLTTLPTVADNRISEYDVTEGCESTHGSIIETLNDIRSVLECSLMCNEHDVCLIVNYNQSSKVCHLHSERHVPVSRDCIELVKYAKLHKDSRRNFVNEDCSDASPCMAANSQCFNNTCQCDAGYSYRYGNESCLTGCDVYGTSFSVYSGYKLSYLNTRRVADTATAEACEQACVAESAFVCRSIDYDVQREICFLSVHTAWTKPDRYTYSPHEGAQYHNRNCQ